MSSKKCQQCGLVNFGQAESCKRCEADLSAVKPVAAPSPSLWVLYRKQIAVVGVFVLALWGTVAVVALKRASRVERVRAATEAPPLASPTPRPAPTQADREDFAARLDDRLLRNGYSFRVGLQGDFKTVLTLQCSLLTRARVYHLVNETDFMAQCRREGFVRVIFTDGYYHSWAFDPREGSPYYVNNGG